MSLIKIGDLLMGSGRVIEFTEARAWRELRYQTIKKLGRRCACCGESSPNAQYEVDHIKPKSIYPELRLDPKNLQILCLPCNQGKGFDDEIDWNLENLKKLIEIERELQSKNKKK